MVQKAQKLELDLHQDFSKNYVLVYWTLLKNQTLRSFEFKIFINTGVCTAHSASNYFALALESANSNLTDNYIFKLSNKNTRNHTNSPQ